MTTVQTGLHPPAQLGLLLHSKQINTWAWAHSFQSREHELLPLNCFTPSPLPLYQTEPSPSLVLPYLVIFHVCMPLSIHQSDSSTYVFLVLLTLPINRLTHSFHSDSSKFSVLQSVVPLFSWCLNSFYVQVLGQLTEALLCSLYSFILCTLTLIIY